MYLRAGNNKGKAGHVRIGVGPPCLLSERPAALSAHQEYKGMWADVETDSTQVHLTSTGAGGYGWSGADGKAWSNGKAEKWGSDAANDQDTNGFTYKDVVGLRLDLDNGTLECIKNGEELGVIFTGLRGPLCWAAELWYRLDCALFIRKPPSGPVEAPPQREAKEEVMEEEEEEKKKAL